MSKVTIILMIISLTIGCRTRKIDENYLNSMGIELNVENSKTTIVQLNRSTGVIFPKNYEISFNRDRLSKRFTPTLEEIQEAELEIDKQYFKSEKRFIYNQIFVRDKDNTTLASEDRLKKFQDILKWKTKEAKNIVEYDRQYLGFIEKEQKVLAIQFINFTKDPYGLRDKLTKEWILGFDGWFAKNTRFKEYNLDTKELNLFGSAGL